MRVMRTLWLAMPMWALMLGGRDVQLSPQLSQKLASLARESLERCGPNTSRHPGNFGLASLGVEGRWKDLMDGSRLRVVFAVPFASESHLGGTLGVSEALIGLEPALELACLAELAPYLPARYRETCARLERDAQGRIVMPPPDIAPSCS